jgi:hypothetical protein
MKMSQKINFPGNGYLKADLVRRSPAWGRPAISAPPSPGISPAKRIMAVSAVVAVLCLCLIIVLVARRPSAQIVFDKETDQNAHADKVSAIRVDSTADLLENLRSRNLWDIGDNAAVPPVLFVNLPEDMNNLDVATKKKAMRSLRRKNPCRTFLTSWAAQRTPSFLTMKLSGPRMSAMRK